MTRKKHRYFELITSLILLGLSFTRLADAAPISINDASVNILPGNAAALPAATQPVAAPQARVAEAYAQLLLHFEPNRGQSDPKVRFLARGRGYTLFLTPAEAVLALRKPTLELSALSHPPALKPQRTPTIDTTVLRIQLVGANPEPRVFGLDQLAGKSNYFTGNDRAKWRTKIPHYARVKYESVYPGVDMVFYGNQGQLEYDFIVAPGSDPSIIRLRLEGANRLAIDKVGNLIVEIEGGEIIQHAPFIYQDSGDSNKTIPGRYVLGSDDVVGFQLAAYDAGRSLVIDPLLAYSTYLGGSSVDLGKGIAVDANQNAYVLGITVSDDFPNAGTPFQSAFAGGEYDVFVTKLNPAGNTLLYSTYLGGRDEDQGTGIVVDASGNAYVSGWTVSDDFPIEPSPGALDTTCGTDGSCNPDALNRLYPDAFVTVLDPTGSELVYSTYLGGSDSDRGNDITVDCSGQGDSSTCNAYVTGETRSEDFPTSDEAYQTACSWGLWCGYDAFVTKLNADGTALIYSTYLGGSLIDEAYGIAVGADGNAYVTGGTSSGTTLGGHILFPTKNAFQATCTRGIGGSCHDAFVTRLNGDASALVYSTFLGGSYFDDGSGIAVDTAGNAYVTGQTNSSDFPTANPFQPNRGGDPLNESANDAFVTKLNSSGSPIYSTYLGGSKSDHGNAIAVDGAGNAYVTGSTSSTDFPTTNPIQAANAGNSDAFVTELNAAGSNLVFSTYLGGSSGLLCIAAPDDSGRGIAVDAAGNAYVTGVACSHDFPTKNAFQPASASLFDAFVTKISTEEAFPWELFIPAFIKKK